MTVLRAVPPEERRRVLTGGEIVRELVAVLERDLPFLPADDPAGRDLRDLHALWSSWPHRSA